MKNAKSKEQNSKSVMPTDKSLNGFLGKGTKFSGSISFEGLVRIDGSFEGEIISEDVFVIGEEGVVKGDIRTAIVRIYGSFEGDICATKLIEICAGASIKGSIKAPSISVEEGAKLNAQFDIGGNGNKVDLGKNFKQENVVKS